MEFGMFDCLHFTAHIVKVQTKKIDIEEGVKYLKSKLGLLLDWAQVPASLTLKALFISIRLMYF